MAQTKTSTNSPTYEDIPINRLTEFVSYGVVEFNIRASKELLISKVSKAKNFLVVCGNHSKMHL